MGREASSGAAATAGLGPPRTLEVEVKGSAGRDRRRIDPRKWGSPSPPGQLCSLRLERSWVCARRLRTLRRGVWGLAKQDPAFPKGMLAPRLETRGSRIWQPVCKSSPDSLQAESQLLRTWGWGVGYIRDLSAKWPRRFSSLVRGVGGSFLRVGGAGWRGAQGPRRFSQRVFCCGEGLGSPKHKFPGKLFELSHPRCFCKLRRNQAPHHPGPSLDTDLVPFQTGWWRPIWVFVEIIHSLLLTPQCQSWAKPPVLEMIMDFFFKQRSYQV